MKYKIKMICYDPGCTPYEDEPAYNNSFMFEEDAYARVIDMARTECEWLNENKPFNTMFSIVDDEKTDTITVNKYESRSMYSTNYKVTPITIYKICEV